MGGASVSADHPFGYLAGYAVRRKGFGVVVHVVPVLPSELVKEEALYLIFLMNDRGVVKNVGDSVDERGGKSLFEFFVGHISISN